MGYQYKYVPVEFGGGIVVNNSAAGHRRLIQQHSVAGWHYVGWIPLTYTRLCSVDTADLVFERPDPEEQTEKNDVSV